MPTLEDAEKFDGKNDIGSYTGFKEFLTNKNSRKNEPKAFYGLELESGCFNS